VATCTISNAGGNYNAAGAWVGGVPPTSADAVVATGTSGQLTITAAAAALTVDLTGYVSTMTVNSSQTWTISGTVFKLASGMAVAGTGTVAVGVACTLTSAGVSTVPWNFTLTGSVTQVLGDNWTITGLVTLGTTTNALVLNSNTLNCSSLTIGVSTGTVSGTSSIKIVATATVTGPSSSGALKNNLEFAAGGGTITIPGTFRYNTGVLKYTSGTMSLTSTPVLNIALAATLNTSEMTWADITIVTASTTTLQSALNWSGTLTETVGAATYSGAFTLNGGAMTISGSTTGTTTIGGTLSLTGAFILGNTTSTTFVGAFAISAASCTISGGQTVTIVANVTISGLTDNQTANLINGVFTWSTGGFTATGTLGGTTALVFGNTGTWSGTAIISNSITINTAGTLTISGTVAVAAITLTYTTGTVVTSGSLLQLTGATCTMNTAGVNWNDITMTVAQTLTINSLLTVTDTFTLPNGAVTFAGSAGFTINILTMTSLTVSRIFTLTQTNTYRVNTAISTVGTTTAIRCTFISSHASNKVPLILGPGATQDLGFCDPTRIDSSGGQTLFTYKGTITTCINWINTFPVNMDCYTPEGQIGI